ncbi:MAG: VTC domain-containing protein [Deltaproteobacteria bacterium]|nr:VTC domain-containing protein [Deltaproteobacteria bacterium]
MNEEQGQPISGHEIKFALNNSSAHIMVHWLQLRCHPDPQFPAGIVSSIYYDTKGWRFLREKVNSDYRKTKIRLRWYSDFHNRQPDDKSYVEAKFKTGARRKKIRVKTDFSGKWLSSVSLDDQRLLKIPYLLRCEGVIIPEQVFPAFGITYKRRRFVEPTTGARLCIDYDISSPSVNSQMLPRGNPFPLKSAVFEVKGNISELPTVLYQMAAMGCSKQSFSKYSNCYRHNTGAAF